MSSTVGRWLTAQADLERTDREVLVMDALNITRAAVIAFPERTIEPLTLAGLNQAAEQLRAGWPLAYLRGHREFWGMRLTVNPHVLIPRPETEHLVELALQIIRPGDRVLDLGTGSGAIAIALARETAGTGVDVIASDRSTEALAIATGNAVAHEAAVTFLRSDWLADIDGSFDVIASNPPYVAEKHPALASLRYEPLSALASGADGLDDIRKIARQAVGRCRRALLTEHGADQGEAVRRILTDVGFDEVTTQPDLAGHDRVTIGFVA